MSVRQFIQSTGRLDCSAHSPDRLLMLRSRSGWFKYEARCAALLMNKGVTCVGAVGLFVLQNMVKKACSLVWCPLDFLVWCLRFGLLSLVLTQQRLTHSAGGAAL